MEQKIKCHRGKCWDLKKTPQDMIDEIFQSNPLAGEIEKDLMYDSN